MSVPEILKCCETRDGASEGALHDAEQKIGRPLPDDYKAVLLETDGLEGFIGVNTYIALWSAADLVSLNESYSVTEFIPELTLLGTNGGDTGYGFRKNGDQVEYVSVPLVGMAPSAISVLGKSITELLARLAP